MGWAETIGAKGYCIKKNQLCTQVTLTLLFILVTCKVTPHPLTPIGTFTSPESRWGPFDFFFFFILRPNPNSSLLSLSTHLPFYSHMHIYFSLITLLLSCKCITNFCFLVKRLFSSSYFFHLKDEWIIYSVFFLLFHSFLSTQKPLWYII